MVFQTLCQDWYNICRTVELTHYMPESCRVWKTESRSLASVSISAFIPGTRTLKIVRILAR